MKKVYQALMLFFPVLLAVFPAAQANGATGELTSFTVSGKASVVSFHSTATGSGILRLKITAGNNSLFTKAHFSPGKSSHQISLKGLDKNALTEGKLYFEAEYTFRNFLFERYVGGTGKSEKRFVNPCSIVAGPRQKLYVVDQGNDRVQVFDWNYRYLFEFGGFAWNGSSGSNEAEKVKFDKPTSVASVHQREIYVTDSNNNRVVRCDLFGRYLGEFANDIVRLPEGITFGTNDTIVVCDTGNDRIIRYKTPDVFDAKLGSYGWSTRQFNKPVSPCYDPSGNLYVTDRGNKRIQVFDPNLRPAFSIKLKDVFPEAVYVDNDYFTYVADSQKGRVIILDNNFKAVAQLPSEGDAFSLKSPVSVAVTPDSKLHIVDKAKNVIAVVRIEQKLVLRRGKIKVATHR